MKNLLLFVFIFLSINIYAQQKNNPLANAAAIIENGNVRFTLLTPGLFRMEWDSLGKFEDNASLVVINRNLPVPAFKKTETRNWLVIATDELIIKYKKNSGRFTAENLLVTSTNNNFKIAWKPGTPNNGNLKGTYRTLDRCNGNLEDTGHGKTKEITLEDGLISRDGWFLWDDTKSFLFDSSDWNWVHERPSGSRQDWYFFGYGNDYKKALYDFTKISGKIPLPPRYAFGYWWSRYWNYSDQELKDLVGNLDRNQIPHDVLVIDMDWHNTESLRTNSKPPLDEFGQKTGWTGYTWNKDYFPEPTKFLEWAKEKNLQVSLNLHPASGISMYEEKYGEFAKAMDFDTAGHHNIPFECADKKFMQNLFQIILHPLKKEGVDFWWLDWQQWPTSKKMQGLSNTWWLNYCFFTDMEKFGDERPLLFHRWGGMGNHRYEIGFSGDTKISWKSLDYQPYFTATASNVGYGYWSHDIGGHNPLGDDTVEINNPELFTRWLQFATFSPIFRTHITNNSRIKREMWTYPIYYRDHMYKAVELRYALDPYIYTMARKAFDSGISLCHPLYYEYPDQQEAYDFKNEYFFGDNIILLPVTAPAKDNFATVHVWLPQGDWYEWFTGTMLKGGKAYDRKFTIGEMPVYVKAGAIIPMYPKVMNLQQIIDSLIVRIYPGGNFETKLYEDSGNNKDYLNNGSAFTKLRSERKSDGSLKLTIFPREGAFNGMHDSRSYDIQIYGSLPPEIIKVNGKNINYAYERSDSTWNYSGNDLTTHIFIPKTNCAEKIEIEIGYSAEAIKNADMVNGMIGKMNRLKISTALMENSMKPGEELPAAIVSANITNLRLEYDPENCIKEIEKFNSVYTSLPDIISSVKFRDQINQEAIGYIR